MIAHEGVSPKVVHVKSSMIAMGPKKRTSLDLPPALLERTDEAVRLGAASSRNNLIAAAVEEYLNSLDRRGTIDERFAEMEGDPPYAKMHLELAARFADSDDAFVTQSDHS